MRAINLKQTGRIGVCVIALCLVVALISQMYLTRREAHAAAGLLKILDGISLGHTRKSDFIEQAQAYKAYLIDNRGSEDDGGGGVLTYRFYRKYGRPAVLAITFNVSDDVIVGRSAGLLEQRCCSVQITQRVEIDKEMRFVRTRVVRENIGDPNFLRLEISPQVSGPSLHRIFAFRTECLLLFQSCDSVGEINRESPTLLSEAIGAGF